MAYFSRFGQVYSVKISLDKNKKSKGHGKVTMVDEASFERILSKRNHSILGKKINAEAFLIGQKLERKELLTTRRKLAIFNVHNSMNKEYLIEVFSQFGEVEDCILKSKNQELYAFMTFKNENDAKYLKNLK
jgi:RNA recognition motif-containing protein